jgi:formate/nitrite transporter
VLICGAELFTENLTTLLPSYIYKKYSIFTVLKNLFIVFFANFSGALLYCYFLVYETSLFGDSTLKPKIIALAEKSANYDWGEAVLLGMGGVWIANLGLLMYWSSRTVLCKMLAIWFPIMGFGAIGYEHVVVNMFVIPAGMMYGANISVGEFIGNNIIPVLIGNMITAVFFISLAHTFVHLDPLS